MSAAHRPGWKLGSKPRATEIETPRTPAMTWACSTASDQSYGRAGPHQPAGVRSPVSSEPTMHGWSGSIADSAAHSASVGRRSTLGRATLSPATPRKTEPSSKIAKSELPRPMFRRPAAIKPGSSDARSRGCSSDSGFAKRTRARHGSSSFTRRASSSRSPTNGYVSTSIAPRAARAIPTRRRMRCDCVRPWPSAEVGRVDGSWSYPTSLTTSSTRSAGSVRSGRQDGTSTMSEPSRSATSQPTASSRRMTAGSSMGIPATSAGSCARIAIEHGRYSPSTAVIPI